MKDHGHKFSRNFRSNQTRSSTPCIQCTSFSWNGCQRYLWSWQFLRIAHTHTIDVITRWLFENDDGTLSTAIFLRPSNKVCAIRYLFLFLSRSFEREEKHSLNQLCSQSIQPDFHSDYWYPTKRRKDQAKQETMDEWTNFFFSFLNPLNGLQNQWDFVINI